MFLIPKLDVESKEPLYIQLYQHIVHEISLNRLKKNDKLPSIRELAKDMNISRNTIESGYNQLLVEGYIISRDRKGYYIGEADWQGVEKFVEKKSELVEDITVYPYDFKSEYVSSENFDYKIWKKHLNIILNAQIEKLYSYSNIRGEFELRKSIVSYFYRSRGLVTSTKEIVVGGGIRPLLIMLSDLFKQKGIYSIGIENPGFSKARDTFNNYLVDVKPIDLGENGIFIDELRKSGVRSCYVSPSHQFPTGYCMPIKERQRLLDWAEEVDGYIIEDDYNGEIIFRGRPIPAMQGLDVNDRVIYLGSFSTVLVPAIRISFMTLPNKLNLLFGNSQSKYTQTASKLEQLALANFINSGDFERHIRKIRKNYTRKQEKVIEYMDMYLPKEIKYQAVKAGLQIIIEIGSKMDIKSFDKGCKKADVLIDNLDSYTTNISIENVTSLVLSYRGIEKERLEMGIKLLGDCIIDQLNKA